MEDAVALCSLVGGCSHFTLGAILNNSLYKIKSVDERIEFCTSLPGQHKNYCIIKMMDAEKKQPYAVRLTKEQAKELCDTHINVSENPSWSSSCIRALEKM